MPVNEVQDFVEENVNGAFGLLGEFGGGLLQVRKRGRAEFGDDAADAVREIAEEDERVGVGAVELIPDEGATSVVLPEPALAATSVTGCARLAARRSIRRGRWRSAGVGRGGRSLVRRKKACVAAPPAPPAPVSGGGKGDVCSLP